MEFELISSQKIAGIVIKKIAGVTKIDLYQMNASSKKNFRSLFIL
jgi:hypothetical protein